MLLFSIKKQSKKQALLERILNYPIESPIKTILLVLAFVVVSALGLPKITVEANLEALMNQQDPLLIELHEIEEEFTESHTLFIGIVAKDSIFTPETISIVQQITDEAWRTPFAYRVDSLSNFQYTQVENDDLFVGDLFPSDIFLTQDQFSQAKQVALSQPEIINQMVSRDEKMTSIHVSFNIKDLSNYDQDTRTILAFIEQIIKPIKAKNPELTFIVSGKLALDSSLQSYIAQDGSSLIPLMLLLMVVILFFLLHSALATLGAIIVVVLTGVATMGFVGWLGLSLDAITSLSPIVIMTLSVADAVHINTATLNGLKSGLSKEQSLRGSIQHNALPVFLTSLTTILGVITFVFTDLPPIQSLGIIISIGVAIAFVLSITLLPAVLYLLPLKSPDYRWHLMSFSPVAEFAIKQHKKILLFLGVICIALTSLAPQNQLNESPELFFKSGTPEKQSIEITNQHMAGVSTIDFVIYTNEPGGVAKPEFLNLIEEFNLWIKKQPGVGHVKSIGDTFKQLNKNMHGDDPSWYRQPESRELAAQYLLLYELSLPYGLDLTNQINLDKSAARLTVTTKQLYAADRQELKYHAIDWFAEHGPEVYVVATGRSSMLEQMTIESFMPDMLRGGMVALAMVSLVLFIVLRNWKLGLVGMLANVIPVAMGYGIWSLISGIANLAVICVAGICLGVVIDFAVHFLTKYRKARSDELSPEDAIRYAFDKIGFPLWTTTIVLVSGFWLLMLSPITLNSSLGALTGMIILITLVFDFFMLPALLLVLDKQRPDKTN